MSSKATRNDREESSTDSIHSGKTPSSNHGVSAKARDPSGSTSDNSHVPGYSSGASTPVDGRSLDGSSHGSRDRAMTGNSKSLAHSNSVLGLDNLIESRKEEGDLVNNMVHIEVRGRK